jgi:hypothetical protein
MEVDVRATTLHKLTEKAISNAKPGLHAVTLNQAREKAVEMRRAPADGACLWSVWVYSCVGTRLFGAAQPIAPKL